MKKMWAATKNKAADAGLLPPEILWRTAQLIKKYELEYSKTDFPSKELEDLGLIIGVLRRRKNITKDELSKKIGCSMEEIIALEMGLMPLEILNQYMPVIRKEINLPNIPGLRFP